MTFMGRPRDQHVHDHAHESPLMWIPLVALAISTVVSSYFIFRPMIADAAVAATDATLVVGLDGAAESEAAAQGALIHVHEAHDWLAIGVGWSWLIAFVAAFLIYRNGLDLAGKFKAALRPIATLLEQKYYFDHLYDFLFVRGCRLVAAICGAFDTYVIDLFANLSASIVERFAVFSGRGVDAHVVDGVFNGMAVVSMDVSNVVRSPQTGRIRNYVLFTAACAVVVVMVLLYFDGSTSPRVQALTPPASVEAF
jgi:NADH-quinone oxidoreductase subunit L